MTDNNWRSQRPMEEPEQGRQRFYSISSTQSFQSFDSSENVPLEIPRRGHIHPSREGNLERIQEVNATIRDARPASEPFNWAAGVNTACTLAKEVIDNYRAARRSREERQAQWEESRRSNSERRTSSIPRDPPTERIDTSLISFRKNKNDNPALRLLAEQKEKDRVKRIKELKKKGTTSFECPDTPLPPYTKGRYHIPEDIYEELEFKRLKDRMFMADSDPEVARHMVKRGIYPSLPSEDYDYVQFGGLRRWINGETVKGKNTASENRRRIKLPSSSSEDTSDSEYEKVYNRLPLRLRGGMKSNSSGSNNTTPQSARTQKKKAATGSSDEETLNPTYMLKLGEDMSALNNASPGLGEKRTLHLVTACRAIGKDFGIILAAEKEKKRLSIKSISDLQEIQARYNELVEELIAENSIMVGRLLEARTASNKGGKSYTVEHKMQTTKKQKASKNTQGEVPRKQTLARSAPSTSRNENAATSYADKVRFREPITSDTEGASDAFTVVQRKKRNKPKPSSGSETGTDRSAKAKDPKTWRAKLERLKQIEPQKAFIVKTGSQDASAVKRTMWSDILKKNNAPNITSTRILPRGDIEIIPADKATYDALTAIVAEKENVTRAAELWPKVMIHEVDDTFPAETLATTIAIQNPTLGLSEKQAIEMIKPLFRRGPRGREVVHWVCMLRPDLHQKLAGSKVFLGMSSCRVTEYFDYNQCFKCLKYGHREAVCKAVVTTCSHCTEKGHKGNECPNKEIGPRCTNCNKVHDAMSKDCRERTKAVENIVKRTSYKMPQ